MDHRKGFTLIEVMVALTVASLVVLLAHRVFTGVTDGAARVQQARQSLDREVNARRWLAEAIGSLDIGREGRGGFAGRPDRMEFDSWQLVPEGWQARVRIVLTVEGGRFVARRSLGEAIALEDSVASVAFDYLLEPGANATWVREWISPVSAPMAVRLRLGVGKGAGGRVDTLLFVVGPRG
jgi:prepilin-type N-terminal cleavage/methylation domain-containing protein